MRTPFWAVGGAATEVEVKVEDEADIEVEVEASTSASLSPSATTLPHRGPTSAKAVA